MENIVCVTFMNAVLAFPYFAPHSNPVDLQKLGGRSVDGILVMPPHILCEVQARMDELDFANVLVSVPLDPVLYVQGLY